MLRPWLATIGLLVGCARDPGPPPRGDCATEGNALRPVCRFEYTEPVAATLTFGIQDEPPRTLTAEGTSLAFTLWDLPPDTVVAWRLRWEGEQLSGERTGVTRTDPLPTDVDITFVDQQAGSDAIERLMLLAACPVPTEGGGTRRGDRHLVVTDRRGVVRWYQPPPVRGEIRAFDASDDGTLWMMVERRTLHAVSLDGTPLVTLTQPATMPYVGHHDVTSRFGQTLMVHARTEQIGTGTWIVDGLTEIRDGVA
ncbi:MAG: hypothetical protein AAF602_21120 [Myxococcota bacterium]